MPVHTLALLARFPRSRTAARPDPLPDRSSRWRTKGIALTLMLVLPVVLLSFTPAVAAASGSVLISPAQLATRPTSGAAWNALVKVANGAIGSADLTDQNNKHGVSTLGVALVAARTGNAALRTKARNAIMSAIGTERVGAGNSTLALGRQLGAYVMAADVINLSGTDDATFRAWLGPLRTKVLGGHSTWNSLVVTHEVSANNWGGFAGASRIAASLYLGDTADVARAAKVFQGFLGDRTAYAGFGNYGSDDLSWACNPSSPTPLNPPCTKSGINVDGAIIRDISRGGGLRWPPGDSGQSYTQEVLQGLILQAELLHQAGYDSWNWSNQALLRASRLVTRASAWNLSSVNYHVPWLLNRRYGTSIPTQTAGMGRVFGFTDWLYGSGAPTGGGGGGTQPAPRPKPPAPAPVVTTVAAPGARLASSTRATTSTVPLRVVWGPKGYTYQVQELRDRTAYRGVSRPSPRTVGVTRLIANGHQYRYRVRAFSGGRWTSWATGPVVALSRIGEASPRISYKGTWRSARASAYIGGAVRYARSRGASATFTFTGRGVAWVGPKGPTRGSARVFVDGVFIRTVSFYARSFSMRQVAFAANWASVGTHTMTIKVVGTAGHPMVAIDAFYVLR